MGQTASPHVDSATAAGLRYVSDAMPGIKRLRKGRGFSYVNADGQVVHDKDAIKRFRSLVIPPAWTDVWICPLEDGHLQVTARDARGRKQYRYHPEFRQQRDSTKFERLFEFGEVVWKIRERVENDVQLPGLPREKVLATVVWLLEKTLIRVGTEELSRENKSYGLTTLKRKHVAVVGDDVRFEFRGKSGVEHAMTVTDERIARIVQRCHDLRGEDLFQYLDDYGKRQGVEAEHVNEYLKDVAGVDVTAKDFRTWAGTMIAAQILRDVGAGATKKESERNVVEAIDHTASRLGNTRAVCRKYYVHPALVEAYLAGVVLSPTPKRRRPSVRIPGGKLRKHEAEVLEFLRARLEAARAAAEATEESEEVSEEASET